MGCIAHGWKTACGVALATWLCAGSARGQGPYPDVRWIAPVSLPPSFPPRNFFTTTHWQGGAVPGMGQTALFDGTGVPGAFWVVDFPVGTAAFTSALKIRGCTVQMRLNGTTYNVTNLGSDGAFLLGSSTVTAATRLDLLTTSPNSALNTGLVTVIDGAGSITVNVNSGNTFGAGGLRFRRGTMRVFGGGAVSGGVDVEVFGQVIVLSVQVGGPSGATLQVDSGGAFSSSTSTFVDPGGSMLVSAGGRADTARTLGVGGQLSVGVPIRVGGEPLGSGDAAVRAGERLSIVRGSSVSAPSYSQISGELSLGDFNGSAQALSVSGAASLSGTVRVSSLAAGFNPPVGSRFALLRPGSLTGRWDVGVFPALLDSRFLRVEYVTSPTVGVDVVVDTAANPFGFLPPASASAPGVPRAAVLANVNGDVFPELVLAIPGATAADPGSLVILTNGGVNTMGAWLGFTGSVQIAVGRDPSALDAGDLNGDGRDDLVVAERGDDRIRVLLANGAGQYPPANQAVYATGDAPAGVVIAVLDELPGSPGATPDVAVAAGGSASPQVNIFRNNGSGGYTGQAPLPLPPGGGAPSSTGADDTDNDKDIDVIVGGPNGLVVFPNAPLDGPEGVSFGAPIQRSAGGAVRSLRTSDLNGDGFPEVVAAVFSPTQGGLLAVFPNAQGTLGAAATTPLSSDALGVASGDTDADGDDDVAVLVREVPTPPASPSSFVSPLRNDTTGSGGPVTLTLTPGVAIGEEPSAALIGDVDNDGVADLLTANAATVLDGGRGAGPPRVQTYLSAFPDPLLGDANGDGSVNFLDLNIVLAAFGRSAGQPGYVAGADFNRDGSVNFLDLNVVLARFGT